MGTVLDSAAPREARAVHSPRWPRLFEYWHLLSLDAPTVAALWACFFARAMHISLPWHAPLLLAIGTWLIYAADRILDGSRRQPVAPLQERHRFHARHRKAFLVAAAAPSGTLLWLICARMTANARHEDTVLFAAALVYFLIVHYPGQATRRWLPKELAVGIVFAAATAVPAWSRVTSGHAQLLPAIALFAGLCWLNCVAIERWEKPFPLHAEPSFAIFHPTTHWAKLRFAGLSGSLSTTAAALAIWPRYHLVATEGPHLRLAYLAIVVSAVTLTAIDLQRERLSPMELRIAADASLLTPLLFLPFLG